MPSACLFNPSPEDTDRVLHRFADHEVSFHDIADEFKTTVPALVLWLARPDIAQRIADLRSAGAERTRTIAALYLPRTIPVLMRIIDSHDHDIGHRLDDPRDPATPILKLRERESVRKAITLIYRLANYTDKPAVPRVARASELPVRSAPVSPVPRAIEVAALSDFDANSRTNVPPPVASTSSRSRKPLLTTGGGTGVPPVESAFVPSPSHTSDLTISPFDDLAISPALPPLRGDDSEFPSALAPPERLITDQVSQIPDHLSPITPHALEPFVPRSIPSRSTSSSPPSFAPSRSNPNTPSALLQRAGTAPRRSRAGPIPRVA